MAGGLPTSCAMAATRQFLVLVSFLTLIVTVVTPSSFADKGPDGEAPATPTDLDSRQRDTHAARDRLVSLRGTASPGTRSRLGTPSSKSKTR